MQSKSRRERQVVRLLMSENFLFFFSMQVSGREESAFRNLFFMRSLLSENFFSMKNLLSE